MVSPHFPRILFGVFLIAGTGAFAPAQEATPADLDAAVREALRVWEVPGAAVVVVRGDTLMHLKGYGRRELGRIAPITADTVFPLASCTKAFTAVGLAIAVDDGKFTWDDPVRKHLPDFQLFDKNATELVTLRDLVCHRTGVGGHDLLWYRTPWGQTESIRRISRIPPSGPFRATFAYQSVMFMAAGQAAGKYYLGGWAGLTRERILVPLGMTATTLSEPDPAKSGDRAAGHRKARDGTIGRTPEYPMPEPNPAGSVHTTARDVGKWLQFQLGDGTNIRGKRVVSQAGLRETHTPQTIIPLEGPARAMNPHTHFLTYAMGWVAQDYRGVKVQSHAGWIDGFRVQLTLIPEKKIGFALLANLHGTRMNLALSNRFIDLLMNFPETDWNAHYGGLDRADEAAAERGRRDRDAGRKPDEKPSLPLAAFVGEYEHPAYGTCKVTLDKGQLRWEWSSFAKELEPYRGDVFEIHDEVLRDPLVAFTVERERVATLRALDVEFRKVK